MQGYEVDQEVNAYLTSSGAPAAKFGAIGDTVKGTIVDAQLRDQTELGTGEVKRYPDGNAMKQVVITLQTAEHDDDDDDGRRRVYAKGQMLGVIRAAVGRDGIEIGGELAVQYTGDGERSQKGFNPPKQYRVWYKAPKRTVSIAGNPLDDDDPGPFEE